MDDSPKDSAPSEQATALLKIGDFARLAGTNLRTLRYYEEVGLLEPAARSSGGFRFYRPEALNRLRMVVDLQRLGLDLARIRSLMDTRGKGLDRAGFLARVRQALEEQAALIGSRMAELETQRAGIRGALAKLNECVACDHHPSADNNFCHPCQVDGRSLPVDLSALF